MRFALLVLAGALAASPALSQTKAFPVATAQAAGMDGAVLAGFDADIAAGKYGNVDSLLVLRHGKAVLDRKYTHDYDTIYAADIKVQGALNAHDPGGPYNYFNPWWHPFYRRGDLHTMQSVTKTVTSITIGVAVTRGDFPSLDTPVMTFFDAARVANVDDRKRRMTIRSLITMTAGLAWNSNLPYSDPGNTGSAMEASEDWVKFTMDLPMSEEPGSRWNYNDGAPVVLAYIFRKATGQDLEEYAAKYLFAPLGIERFYWKRIPYGLADAEGGLYLEPHDLAKLMLLFEHDGQWEGKQVVSRDWVKASIAPRIAVDATSGTKYGYLWWLYPEAKGETRLAFGGSGFGGQLPVVILEYDIVIVVTAWNIGKQPHLSARVAIDRVLAAVPEYKH